MSDRVIRTIKAFGEDEEIVWSAAWSPDGSRLATTSSQSGLVRCFTSEGREIWTNDEDSSSILSTCWSPDGGRILTACWNGTLRVRDAESGHTLLVAPQDSTTAYSSAWFPDGRRVAMGIRGRVLILDAETGAELANQHWSEGSIWSVSPSPTGEWIAAGAEHGVRVWNAETLEEIAYVEVSGQVTRIVWMGERGPLFLGRTNGLTVVHPFTRDRSHEEDIPGHDEYSWVGWAAHLPYVAYAPRIGEIAIRDTETWSSTHIGAANETIASDFSPDGTILCVGSGRGDLVLYDVSDVVAAPDRAKTRQPDRVSELHAASVGRRRVTSTVEPGGWFPQARPDGDLITSFRTGGSSSTVYGLSFAYGGRLLVAGTESHICCHDTQTGTEQWKRSADRAEGVSPSPDGSLVAVGGKDLLVFELPSGDILWSRELDSRVSEGISWSPRGDQIALGLEDEIEIVGSSDGGKIGGFLTGIVNASVEWTRDASRLVVGGIGDAPLQVWSTSPWEMLSGPESDDVAFCPKWSADARWIISAGGEECFNLSGSDAVIRRVGDVRDSVNNVAWMPGDRFAALACDDGVRLWDVHADSEVAHFDTEDRTAWSLSFSPGGSMLACGTAESHVYIWDTRSFTDSATQSESVGGAMAPPFRNRDLRLCAAGLLQLQRLGYHPPLSVARDLLLLTGAAPPVDDRLAPLAEHPGVRRLASLRWSPDARIGLVSLLLREVPFDDRWRPRTDTWRFRSELHAALAGEQVEPEPPTLPLEAIKLAADAVDERVHTLLSLLGPGAVAADPGLPLRLLPKVPDLPPLSVAQQHLLQLRIPPDRQAGSSFGQGSGGERGGFERHGDLRSLIPSQLALPDDVLLYRHLRGELLFRGRTGAEPPRLRPVVLLLDVSPPTFGPIEETTRLAAYAVARSLLEARMPVMLVTTGSERGAEMVRPLVSATDLVEIWTARSLHPARPGRAMRLARSMREQLRDGPLEPVVLLLTHAWFGSEESLPEIPNLRGLFVQYPERTVRPAMADACERWVDMPARASRELGRTIGELVG